MDKRSHLETAAFRALIAFIFLSLSIGGLAMEWKVTPGLWGGMSILWAAFAHASFVRWLYAPPARAEEP